MKNEQKDSKKNFKLLTIQLFSMLALVLSVISVCRSYCRTEDLGFDYSGVFVGVLSVLVTFLVAWNIYSVIDINSKVKEMQKEIKEAKLSINEKTSDIEKETKDKIDGISTRVFKTQSDIYKTAVSFEERIINPRMDNIPTIIIIDMIAAIDLLSKAGSFEEANIHLGYYTIAIKDNANTIKNRFDNGMKTNILSMLYGIPNRGKLLAFEKFEKEVLNVMGINDDNKH